MNNYMRKILQLTVIVIILTGVLSSCLLPLRKNDQADRGTRESRQGRVTDQSESESSETETEIEVEVTSLAEPEEVVADFLASLRAADFDALSEQSDGLFSEDVLIHVGWPISRALFEATFGDMTWTMGEVGVISEETVNVNVSIHYPNHYGVADELVRDQERMVEATRPVVLYYAQQMNELEAFMEYSNLMAVWMVEAIEETEEFLVGESAFQLQYDDADRVWRVTRIPEGFFAFSDFYSFDPLNRLHAEGTIAILMMTAAELFEEEAIGRNEYEQMITAWIQMAGPTEYSAEEVRDAMESHGWYDLDAESFVDNYDESVEAIFYRIYFDQAMMGLVLQYEVFVGEDEIFMGASAIMMLDEEWVTIGIRGNPGFPAETYRVVITLPDGSVLVESSIETNGS